MTASFNNVAMMVRQSAHLDALHDQAPFPADAIRKCLDGLRVSKYHYRRLCEEYEKAYRESGAA